jgi:hypothetical protein
MKTVKFHGVKLEGKATLKQRVTIARLEGRTNYGEKISKSEASVRIGKLLRK